MTVHRLGSDDGSDDHTATFDMTYYADVADGVSGVSVRTTGWSVNCCRGDDIIVDASIMYSLTSGTSYYTWYNGNSWMTFDVWTHALPKAKTFLITDGNATVTSAGGQHRLTGQDRYFVFTFDATSSYAPFVYGVNAIVVPRSIFLDSKLKADFDKGKETGNTGYYWPLADATLYGEDLGKADVSEGVAGVIAKSLSGSNAYNVLDRLLRNTTNVLVHSYVDITSYAVLANLPADVVRILPWTGVTSGPTGDMPKGFWDKISGAASAVINSLVRLGQLIYQGLVALGTFLVNLAEAIWNWGMQAAGAVWNAVASVVQKISEAANTLFNWIKDFAIAAFNLVIEGFKTLASAALSEVVTTIVELARHNATIEALLLGLPLALGAVLRGKQVLERLFAAMEIVEGSLTVLMAIASGGVAAFVKSVVAFTAKDSIVKTIMGAVLLATIGSIVITTVESFDDGALNSFPGSVAKWFVGGITLLGASLDWLKARREAHATGVSKWFSAAGWAMVGLLAELAGSPLVEAGLGALGLTDPLTKGAGQLGVDIVATAAAAFGLYELFKKHPGQVFLEGTRKALVPITDQIEHWVTYIAFFGTSSAFGFHIGQGLYNGFN